MASNSLAILVLATAISAVLVSPAQSQRCKSQTFSGRTFANCSDLTALSAELHWTYHEDNTSLTVAFSATPPSSDGWVAWAINPTGTGMAGAQAFVAARRSNGSVPVTTFNISSYTSIVPSELSIQVFHKAAEFSGGKITIFATVRVPTGKAASLNHIWQVGPGFNSSNGFLLRHAFAPENLRAVGTLNLVSRSPAASDSPSASPSSAPSPRSSPGPSATTGGRNGAVSVNVSFGNLVLCALVSLLVLVGL